MTPPHPETLEQANRHFQKTFAGLHAEKAIICGSGWSGVTDQLKVIKTLSFSEIPGLGSPGVVGHRGELALCELAGEKVWIFKGRRHFYEGEGWTPIAIPIYLCAKNGVKELLLTNSAGAVNPGFAVGDLMIITDHFNAMGDNPLVGEHQEIWGPRFPDLSHTYGAAGQTKIATAARSADVSLQQGVYFATRGPVYETPAEVRAWKTLGADAVGMSTVPEAILAHAAGIQVSGISCMTNFAAGISPHPLSHEEVTETTAKTMPKMQALLRAWIEIS
ncbi:purine-nucleoside phosphorylase [Kiritimatiellaeota bacterium B1221]|nr:purine-nucleoside phosphorylase [Kiritimatiellaeota bacterium B1221]